MLCSRFPELQLQHHSSSISCSSASESQLQVELQQKRPIATASTHLLRLTKQGDCQQPNEVVGRSAATRATNRHVGGRFARGSVLISQRQRSAHIHDRARTSKKQGCTTYNARAGHDSVGGRVARQTRRAGRHRHGGGRGRIDGSGRRGTQTTLRRRTTHNTPQSLSSAPEFREESRGQAIPGCWKRLSTAEHEIDRQEQV